MLCHHDPDVDQHAGADVCVDWTVSSEGGLIQRLLVPHRPWRRGAALYGGSSAAWHGVQFPAVYGAADQYVTLQDGSFPAGGKLRSGSKSAHRPFVRVTLPLSLPGVINGITLVFLPAVSSFFIPKLLGGGQYFLIGNLIENQFITVGEWNFGSAISMIMAVIMMLLMMAVRQSRDPQPAAERRSRPCEEQMKKKGRPFGNDSDGA